MKTLADLKRDASTGRMYMVMTERYGSTEIIERLKGVRPVIKVNTVAITLQNADGQSSDLRFNFASLTEYTGDSLVIYNPGVRDLTAEEKAELNRADAERKAYEQKYPYSESYYHMKAFFKNSPFPYLAGCETVKGKRYERGQIIDNQIKGEAILKYKVVFADTLEEAIQMVYPEPVVHQMDITEYLTA